MSLFLCAFEAVNLDNLFSDCHDLSTTRGGGLAVLNIGRDVAKKFDIKPISSSASQGLMELSGESEGEVEGRVRQVIAGLPLMNYATVAVAACESGIAGDGKFQERLAGLKTRMRLDQMRSPSVIYPALNGKGVCEIDMVRPAAPGSNQSAFTAARRTLGQQQKRVLLKKILGDILPADVEVVSDLNQLAEDKPGRFGNAGGKIAVLRFDGNGFGAAVDKCGTAADLTAFSEARIAEQERYIRALFGKSVSEEWLTPERQLRLEIVVYGGDEVTIITPAWLGWQALDTFYSQPQVEGISYSGGVVFCHSNAPIHSIKKLAGELTDKAKDYAVDRDGNKGSYAVYQTLESFDAIGRNLDEWMAQRYPATAGGTGAAIPGAEEISILRSEMSYWKSALSKRKLYELATAIVRGEPAGLAGDLTGVLNELLESKGSDIARFAGPMAALQRRLGNAAFLHILELWDYAGID